MSADPHPYDHVYSDGTSVDAGTYRVVGVGVSERQGLSGTRPQSDDDSVTLLRVADAHGKRIHEGHVVYVTHREYEALETADNPDEPSLLVSLALTLSGGGVVGVEILFDVLTTVTRNLGVDPLADVLVVASALGFAVGVQRLVSLRRF